jgi:hypothetical protein
MKNWTPGGEGVLRRVFVNYDDIMFTQYLRAVGVGAGVGHAQQPRLGVLELEVLVVELAAVDGLPAGAVACKHTNGGGAGEHSCMKGHPNAKGNTHRG